MRILRKDDIYLYTDNLSDAELNELCVFLKQNGEKTYSPNNTFNNANDKKRKYLLYVFEDGANVGIWEVKQNLEIISNIHD